MFIYTSDIKKILNWTFWCILAVDMRCVMVKWFFSLFVKFYPFPFSFHRQTFTANGSKKVSSSSSWDLFFLLHSRIFFMISSCAYLGGKKDEKKVKKIQNRYDIFSYFTSTLSTFSQNDELCNFIQFRRLSFELNQFWINNFQGIFFGIFGSTTGKHIFVSLKGVNRKQFYL